MKQQQPKPFFIFILLVLLVIFILFIFVFKKRSQSITSAPFSPATEHDCAINVQEKIVRGNSLSGLINAGQTVKILFGFYDCNEIKKNDLIIYNYESNSEPLIKIIKAIPNDKFHLEKSTVDCWNILINNKILQNSQNIDYCIGEKGYKMLFLYEKDYHGVIPENSYLILGNLAEGSMDSAYFGLIDKNDILGKAEKLSEL